MQELACSDDMRRYFSGLFQENERCYAVATEARPPTMQTKAEAAEQAHQEQRKEAAKEAQRCAEKLLAAQKSHDAIAKEAAAARETAARLSGQLEAVQVQTPLAVADGTRLIDDAYNAPTEREAQA